VTQAVQDVFSKVAVVLARGYVEMPDATRLPIKHNITLKEAEQIATIISANRCKTTAETGVAFGISTLTICAALEQSGNPLAKHFGIDPNQISEYGGAALALLREHGLEKRFTLLEGPTHLEAPRLIGKDVLLDFAFIDGWHTFDYTLLDFFLMDKLLKVKGIVGFHDSYGPAKRKVFKFLLTHRRYKRLPVRRISIIPWLKMLAAGVVRLDPSVRHRLDRLPALCFFEKQECWEPNFDFYAGF
jgi:predicted O-methyltransferase YrrM